jgi:hypothetical protein
MKARSFRRLLIMIIALMGLVYGFYWWINQANDFQLSSSTGNYIAAQMQTDSGSQVVVLDKEGKVTESKDYVKGSEDRDVIWDPQGNRVFFISDRKDEGFHIYRWDPERNASPDQKSIDRAGRSNLAFDVEESTAKEISALVTVRGTVQEFFPKTARSQQVLPPNPKEKVTGDASGEDGATSAMELIYKRFGTSFRVAKWFQKRRFIAAVMRREDQGETLIVQDLMPDDKGQLPKPLPLFTADKFHIAVDSASGNLVISVMGIIPPNGEDGKPRKVDFKHGVFIFNPTAEGTQRLLAIVAAPSDVAAFAQLAIAPDGSKVVFTSGPYTGDGNLDVKGLVSCPLQPNGGQAGAPIISGSVADPTFSPDSSMIAFVKREGSRRAVFLAKADGSDSKNLSGSNADFANPVFSPQYK